MVKKVMDAKALFLGGKVEEKIIVKNRRNSHEVYRQDVLKIFDYYKKNIMSAHDSKAKACDYIERLLKEYTFDELIIAINNYKKKTDFSRQKQGLDINERNVYAIGAQNFFSPESKKYLDYIDETIKYSDTKLVLNTEDIVFEVIKQ